MTNAFYSPSKRDFLDQVSREQKSNPGPGAYDTQIQDKLKVLNHQLSTRYHLKPFGFGAPRFEEKGTKPKRNTIDFNQMISVKDAEITMKRQAFRDTIRMHKRAANTHQHSTFASTSERFKMSPSTQKDKLLTAEEEAQVYRTRVEANKSARKNLP